MLTRKYPHKPPRKTEVTICNHQAESPLCMAYCLIWWFARLKNVWSYTWHWMSLLRPGVIKHHKPKPFHPCVGTHPGLCFSPWVYIRTLLSAHTQFSFYQVLITVGEAEVVRSLLCTLFIVGIEPIHFGMFKVPASYTSTVPQIETHQMSIQMFYDWGRVSLNNTNPNPFIFHLCAGTHSGVCFSPWGECGPVTYIRTFLASTHTILILPGTHHGWRSIGSERFALYMISSRNQTHTHDFGMFKVPDPYTSNMPQIETHQMSIQMFYVHFKSHKGICQWYCHICVQIISSSLKPVMPEKANGKMNSPVYIFTDIK